MGKKQPKASKKHDEPVKQPREGKLERKAYEAKLGDLHMELVKMQYWIKATGKKIVVLFEGRDAAGKGGAIKCVAEPLNPPRMSDRRAWQAIRYRTDTMVFPTLRRAPPVRRRDRFVR